jgi:hypothetical protein
VAPVADKTAKGAEEFVRYFWAVHNYAYATLDSSSLDEVSDRDCSFCSATSQDISSLREAKTLVSGADVHVVSISIPPADIKTGIIVGAVINQEPSELVHSDGSTATTAPLSQAQSFVSLNWEHGEWLIADVAIEEG